MDWLFRLQIPYSRPNVLVIRPLGKFYSICAYILVLGKTFITGISSSYRSDEYNAEILGKHMDE